MPQYRFSNFNTKLQSKSLLSAGLDKPADRGFPDQPSRQVSSGSPEIICRQLVIMTLQEVGTTPSPQSCSKLGGKLDEVKNAQHDTTFIGQNFSQVEHAFEEKIGVYEQWNHVRKDET